MSLVWIKVYSYIVLQNLLQVELSDSQIFMGSTEGQTNAFMRQETVKVKGWFCPNLFQEHFPEHFAQIMHLMPLKEYLDPKSGHFNLAAKLPEYVSKPDLGPSVHIAYGEPEEFMQGHFITRLSYESYDLVGFVYYSYHKDIFFQSPSFL